MRAVLGIDAAWTEHQPSGVSLVVDDGTGWRLLKIAASYKAFTDEAEHAQYARHLGSLPDAQAILAAAGVSIDLVAIDMPLSMVPIVGRRASDNLISSLYGSRHAGTHTPSALRPGQLSDELRLGFDEIGFPLLTERVSTPGLIEVYPHPALIELATAAKRLPYKHSKAGKYWPEDTPALRRQRLFGVWTQIVELLDARIKGVAAALPMPALDCRGYEMKAFEDTLDAVVCAWVGTCVLDGKAGPYGDMESAIWIPELSTD
jgi:predicted RNase H-like nuclease